MRKLALVCVPAISLPTQAVTRKLVEADTPPATPNASPLMVYEALEAAPALLE